MTRALSDGQPRGLSTATTEDKNLAVDRRRTFASAVARFPALVIVSVLALLILNLCWSTHRANTESAARYRRPGSS